MNGREKSDPAIVATKPTNEAGQPAEEPVEPRAGAEGNADQQSTHRTQIRARVTQALDRVRQAARQRKKERFTALLHHVNPDTLRLAFYALKRKAAPGVDGVRWDDYEAELEPRLADLHGRNHRGAYRPQPSMDGACKGRPSAGPPMSACSTPLLFRAVPSSSLRMGWPGRPGQHLPIY
jgi:RNA-directed DNA polymerase